MKYEKRINFYSKEWIKSFVGWKRSTVLNLERYCELWGLKVLLLFVKENIKNSEEDIWYWSIAFHNL